MLDTGETPNSISGTMSAVESLRGEEAVVAPAVPAAQQAPAESHETPRYQQQRTEDVRSRASVAAGSTDDLSLHGEGDGGAAGSPLPERIEPGKFVGSGERDELNVFSLVAPDGGEMCRRFCFGQNVLFSSSRFGTNRSGINRIQHSG